MIRRIHKKLKKAQVNMNDIADCVIGYTEKDVDEEVDDYQLTRAFDLILAINLINTRTE